MKPVISANMLPFQAAFFASSTRPSRSVHSMMAASTGVGLFQWVQPQPAQRSRSFMPLSSSAGSHSSGVAHCGQKR